MESDKARFLANLEENRWRRSAVEDWFPESVTLWMADEDDARCIVFAVDGETEFDGEAWEECELRRGRCRYM